MAHDKSRGKAKRPKDKEKQGSTAPFEARWKDRSMKPQKAKAAWIGAPIWQDCLRPGLLDLLPIQSGKDVPLTVGEM